jgi:hypothetical protein
MSFAHQSGGGGAATDHATLINVTANQHHAQSHAIGGADHSGSLAHAALSGIGAGDHHAQAHAIGGADHSGSLAHAALSGIGAGDHHAQAHGQADHTDRTRRIPLAVLQVTTGTAQTDTHGALTPYGHYHVADVADDFIIFAPVVLPVDFVSGLQLHVVVSAEGASGGNYKIQRTIASHAPDGDAASTSCLSATDGQAAPAAANTTKKYVFNATTDPAAGELVHPLIGFIRSDGAVDTNTNQADFLGAWFEYTADS